MILSQPFINQFLTRTFLRGHYMKKSASGVICARDDGVSCAIVIPIEKVKVEILLRFY